MGRHIVRAWIAMSALVLATACGQPANKPAETAPPVAVEKPKPPETQVFLGDLAKDVTAPALMPAGTAFVAGLQAGQAAKLVINACPKTEDDTLQALICGETYVLFWQPTELRWGLIGPNETLRKQKAKSDVTAGLYAGGYPPESKLFIAWGLPLTFDDTGEVKQDGRLIGKLETAK
jgi:hypothetical protein